MSSSAGSGSLARYILIRIILVIPMMLVLLTVVFILLRVAPGDPVTAAVGGHLPPAIIAQKRHDLGLDQPLYKQYFEYLGHAARFDFGTTITDNQPVLNVVRDKGGATLTLTAGAFLVALIIGLPLGRLAGRYRDSGLDAVIRVFGIVTYAAPIFWVGVLLVAFVATHFPSWPTYGIASAQTTYVVPSHTHILIVDAIYANYWTGVFDILQHCVLPCVTLGLLITGVIIRLVRVNVIQALKGDYVEAARARGIPEGRVVRKHAFRNALVPVITVIGLQVALTLSGAVLTETTFNWPGVGSALVNYLNERDYPAVQGLVTFFAIVVVIVSLLVDILNALVDPRVRY
jgi:peptide/nickel transport system permease protein